MANVIGTSVANLLNGTSGADSIFGAAGNDTLSGLNGNDTLNGGTGRDSLAGGAGNDTYVVDATTDKIVEAANAGVDTVQSSATWSLGANLENLVLTGTGAINGTGNTLANRLTGNAGNNSLSGLGGADTLSGAAGNDTLDGGTGTDSMAGGAGSDTYVVDATADKVNETAAGSGGVDTVRASATYTLSNGIENLTLTGTGAVHGTGNSSANTLTGNNAANRLDGAGGNDTLTGGGGADTLLGGSGNDVLTWDAADVKVDGGTGTDTLRVTGAALDLTAVADGRIQNVEAIDLAGTTTLTLAASDVVAMSGTTDVLRIAGGTGDVVNAGSGWTQGADTVIGGQTYAQYTNGDATLQVDLDIDRSGIDTTPANAAPVITSDGGAATAEVTIDENTTAVTTVTATDGDEPAQTLTYSIAGGADAAFFEIDPDTGELTFLAPPDYENPADDGGDNVYEVTVQVSDGVLTDTQAIAVTVADVGTPVSALNLSALTGANGFELNGEAEYDFSGYSISSAGDVNGDGFDDLLIGAFGRDTNGDRAGASYVVFGKASGFGANVNLSTLDGTNGFELNGEAAYDYSGRSVSSAGDVNGDGYDDLLIGARSADTNGNYAGASYVVFGKASGFGANVNLSTLDGANGFEINGETAFDFSGWSVSSAGDVNGDGYDDLLIGAQGREINGSAAGASYVVFGKVSGFGANLDLSALDGANGFEINGEAADDYSGRSVASAGDVNGDGYDDLLIGADGRDINGSLAGASYVVFGKASGFGANLNLSALDGANGFELNGEAANDRSAFSISTAGDVNGDGYDDLLIGAYGHDTNGSGAGASYVVFGKASGFGANLDLSTLDGANGFEINGETADDDSGRSVVSAGDVNGDGYDDLLIGADNRDVNGSLAGASYVVFGKASGFGANLDLSALDGVNGFEINGETAGDQSGWSVSSAGDVNGDGYDDLMINASVSDTNGFNAGASYVVFGRNTTELAFAGTSANDTYTGTASADVIIGGRGADTLTGGGGADVFRGGQGDDRIVIADATFFDIDGGSGTDTLALAGSGMNLDLTAIADSKTTALERIDMTGAGNNTLTLKLTDLLNLSDTSNTLTVDGDAGDAVVVTDGIWTNQGVVTVGGVDYMQLVRGSALLQVQTQIDISGINVIAAAIDLSTLDGANGFEINGETAGDRSGYSVSSAGDVNGDGYDDLLIGAWDRDINGSAAGASYVVFGKASGFGANLDLSALDGANGFELNGEAANDRSALSISTAGDVNGDGYDDLLIGAYLHDTNGTSAGASYVVFGKASGFGANLDLSALDGANGFELNGEAAGDFSGRSVSSAGDVNGDGYADLLIGATGRPNGDFAGATYVVFGQASGFGANLDLSALDGTNGFELNGETVDDYSGYSVSSAGDVNGDGYADLLIGAPFRDINGNVAGASYVVFGQVSGFGANLDLSALDGTNGFELNGETAGDRSGYSVSSAGDVNGDGYADLLIGAFGRDTNGIYAGASYVVFGKASGFGANLHLSALDGANGFEINGEAADDDSGRSVASAGDVNGDGYDDLLIGASSRDTNGSGAGASYVVFGKASGFGANLNLSALDGVNGFELNGETAFDSSGQSVSSAGDMNGDGYADILIGAWNRDINGGFAGASYVVYGRNTAELAFAGTAANDTYTGTASADVIIGGRGADTLTGGGGADVFRGGQGDDRIVVSDATFFDIDGGSGTDTLALAGNGMNLDLTAIADSKTTALERIDMTGAGNNTLTLKLTDLLNLSDTSNTLTVDGDAGDAVVVTNGTWTVGTPAGGYAIYTLGAATLRIDQDITAVTITTP